MEESQGQVLQIEMQHRLSDKEKFLEMQALEKDDIIKELNLKVFRQVPYALVHLTSSR